MCSRCASAACLHLHGEVELMHRVSDGCVEKCFRVLCVVADLLC